MSRPKVRTIALLGYCLVGKTALSVRYTEGDFIDWYDPTIENTFEKTINVNNQDYRLKLIDTAGQDEYFVLNTLYTISTHAYVIVYDITVRKSFEVAEIIYEKLCDITGRKQLPVVLVGNKIDLKQHRKVNEHEGRMLANSWRGAFLEVSAKLNESIENIFEAIVMEEEKFNRSIAPTPPGCILL